MKIFDVLVIGGGHAGIEAAASAANMGCSVGLITMDKSAIGRMSCNPAIGGTAKGHLVREVDALGGVMGIIADQTGLQFRMLNKSKGPAVWSPRCQSDRKLYSDKAIEVIELTKNLEIVEQAVTKIEVEDGIVKGVMCSDGNVIEAKAVVLSSGTFLNAQMHTGLKATQGGRFGEKHSTGITESLIRIGFETGRLKTGTPPRLAKNSIDWSILEEQPGDEKPQPFSFRTDKNLFPYLPQVSCHITHTDQEVHSILEKGFHESPMFTGLISGVGPRYCPSIEDKIVRFSEKKSHQLFLEPEGLDSDLIYLNGFSTSLPTDIQLEAMHKIKGLENVKMIRPGYAVEYDFFPPHQVDNTLETKKIRGLYFAGQVNGTSGYEEAAAQGLIAGINAALKVQKREAFVLKRSEAYIGVLIDDLVTKSTEEPYRMFTSRAEHRLLLRQDNADQRLMQYGKEFRLIDEKLADEIAEKKSLVSFYIEKSNNTKLHAREINSHLEKLGSSVIDSTETISKLCKRPEINLKDLLNINGNSLENDFAELLKDDSLVNQVEIELKYEGYISRQQQMVEKLEKYEDTQIPLTLNYLNFKALSTEAREKLSRIKPRSIGQASRISGVTPSDISILLVYLKK